MTSIQTLFERQSQLIPLLTMPERHEFLAMLDDTSDIALREAAMRALAASSETGASLVETFLSLSLRFSIQTKH